MQSEKKAADVAKTPLKVTKPSAKGLEESLKKELSEAKKELKKLQEEQAKKTPLNILDIKIRVSELNAISSKLDQLNERKRELTQFNFGSDAMNEQLEIKDANGKVFKTSNFEVLKRVKELLNIYIDEKIKEEEAKLLAATFYQAS